MKREVQELWSVKQIATVLIQFQTKDWEDIAVVAKEAMKAIPISVLAAKVGACYLSKYHKSSLNYITNFNIFSKIFSHLNLEFTLLKKYDFFF